LHRQLHLPRLRDLHGSRVARFRITEAARASLEKLVFQRHPHREWGTFFRFGYRRTPWGLSLTYVEPLAPKGGDLHRTSPIVSFNPDYISRMTDELESDRLCIGVVHSHPRGWGVTPSPSDDDMDTCYPRLFQPYGKVRPYASLIVNRDEHGDFQFSGRAFDNGIWMPVTNLYTPGRVLERKRSALLPAVPTKPRESSEDALTRWESLVGPKVRERFAGAIVGVVGCSGTGSPAIEVLARAQVGEFVLVDGQRIAPSNLERQYGSRLEDVRAKTPPYKVEVMARMIREINPDARIIAIVGNVLDEIVQDELLRCDFALVCTDTLHGRAALGDLSAFHLIPAIDVGVLPTGHNGRVTHQYVDIMRLAPTDPCPFCRGRIVPFSLSVELMSEDEKRERRKAAAAAEVRGEDGTNYWPGDEPQLPSVG
jgi:tRNA A37 threonylcarbamoyladenosine dehydratase